MNYLQTMFRNQYNFQKELAIKNNKKNVMPYDSMLSKTEALYYYNCFLIENNELIKEYSKFSSLSDGVLNNRTVFNSACSIINYNYKSKNNYFKGRDCRKVKLELVDKFHFLMIIFIYLGYGIDRNFYDLTDNIIDKDFSLQDCSIKTLHCLANEIFCGIFSKLNFKKWKTNYLEEFDYDKQITFKEMLHVTLYFILNMFYLEMLFCGFKNLRHFYKYYQYKLNINYIRQDNNY